MVSHGVCEVFERADVVLFHGETQAGSPTSCAAILATIAEMERLDACTSANKISIQLEELLNDLASHPMVVEHRGVGCFRGVQLTGPSAPLVAAARRRGLIVQPGTDFFMLVPALTYSAEDFDELAASLRAAMADIAS